MKNFDDYTEVTILVANSAQLAAVYALLGGTALASGSVTSGPTPAPKLPDVAAQDTAKSSATAGTPAPESLASDGIGAAATSGASPSDTVLDAEGHPWSAELHASTKGTTKAGLWRMAPGKSRPEPAPGFTKVDDKAAPTGTDAAATAASAGNTAPEASAAPATEEDEFAAFTAAAKATGGAAVATARKWSEADLSKLCNQAATKLGGERVGEIKGVIAKYVTPGETPHSRNIPEANREAFAVELEALAGITFEG